MPRSLQRLMTSPQTPLVKPRLQRRGSAVLAIVAAAVLACWLLLSLSVPILTPDSEALALRQDADRSSMALLPPLSRGALVHTGKVERSVDGSIKAEPRAVRFVPASALTNMPQDQVLQPLNFWLGTDRIGEDVALNLAKGARTSFLVGLIAATLALTLGVGVGAVAGLSRSWVDNLLMRLVDAMMAFPLLLLVLLLDLLFDPGLLSLIVILGGTQWMGVARVVRSEMQRLRSAPFVMAARAVGAGPTRLFFQHLLPNALRPIVVLGLLLIGDSILLESAVSFLGFGTASDLESWGKLVDSGRSYLREAWWISTIPGLAIVLVVTAINLLGDVSLGHTFGRHNLGRNRTAF